jgi:hypothetical protein
VDVFGVEVEAEAREAQVGAVFLLQDVAIILIVARAVGARDPQLDLDAGRVELVAEPPGADGRAGQARVRRLERLDGISAVGRGDVEASADHSGDLTR